MSALLDGVRVLEFGILFNGDMLGMLLGDMGAEIIKIESPAGGDYLREMHGHLAPGYSPTHLQANKNKRSVALDVRQAAGKDVFWRLLTSADVFVDGLSGSACERMGLGYADQRARNPRIIYCQHSGFGSTGPYASLPTHGVMPAAMAGGKPYGMSDDGLMRPTASPDLLGGATQMGEVTIVGSLVAAMHVAAALAWRNQSGTGTRIDVATSDAAVLASMVGTSIGLNRKRLVDLDGMPTVDDGEWRGAKYQYYQTADEKVVLFCCMERKFWSTFCEAVGRPDLIESDESRFDYGTETEDLRTEVQNIMAKRTLEEWMALAVAHHLPIGPAHRSIAEVAAEPQFAAREIFIENRHPVAGDMTYIGSAAMVDEQPYAVRRPAPGHGEHTDEVLSELGYGSGEIEELRGAGVIK